MFNENELDNMQKNYLKNFQLNIPRMYILRICVLVVENLKHNREIQLYNI